MPFQTLFLAKTSFMKYRYVFSIALLAMSCLVYGQKNKSEIAATPDLGALKFRSIGPAMMSGRISDMAVNPRNHKEYYLAFASGNIFKTTNSGTTYEPIFENYGSYSIGCLALDPNNPHVLWVGTGENNNQRSVAYGDGIYKSIDGGKTFQNMGLQNSEHIGMIAIDPRNSDVVYVAAYGPLWSEGGERGLYKTTDGGKNWTRILHVSQNTGINEVHFDPRNPDVIYVAAHQRRRHVFTYISGGPESAIYKSTDAGHTFEKITKGLPSGDLGRISIAIPPTNPDIVYAMIEGHGFYRSTTRGTHFSKMSGHYTSGNYYVEIYPHPTDENVIFSMDTWTHISTDGGINFNRVPEKNKHVDNHCIWINPDDPNHILMGCDGGLYETWDFMENWHWKDNLPTVQFYRVAVDQAEPFYNVYGGTQDNNSLGGPSQTLDKRGIVNDDWFITNGGDGFKSQVDPTDPNIVYAQAQYGWLVRFDRKSGEALFIQPQPGLDEAPFVWNWDAPLLISPHNNTTLYFGANKVFKTTDRGNNWTAISPDLTRKIDRNKLPVMGKVWSMDAIAYHKSTTIYGNLVSFSESPKKAGLLYAGSDDGLLHITDDDGANWTTYEKFPGVPEMTYTQDIKASIHNEQVVYAVFNNHKNGDFKPYVLKSSNKGKSWTSISGNLPEKGSVYVIVEDHLNPDLLFVGTEFGVFFTSDGGKQWRQLKGGLPTIAVRDMEIQRRESDLVLATFGRGFYILDNYDLLRHLDDKTGNQKAHIFPVKTAKLYHESDIGAIEFKGASYYRGQNAPVGVTLDYYIDKAPETKKQIRQAGEKDQKDIQYPDADAIRAEDREETPYLLFVFSDDQNREVRRMTTSISTGVQRIVWDGKFGTTAYFNHNGAPKTNSGGSHFVPEGMYQVQIFQSIDGVIQQLTNATTFRVTHLKTQTLRAETYDDLLSFQQETEVVARSLRAIDNSFKELTTLVAHCKTLVRNTPGAPLNLLNELRTLELQLAEIDVALNGDNSLASREFATLPGLNRRISMARWIVNSTTSAPTGTLEKEVALVNSQLPNLQASLQNIADAASQILQQLYDAGAPYLRGDLPGK
jgi:photosystem II stability/assembly factor-like uncharacterized protein